MFDSEDRCTFERFVWYEHEHEHAHAHLCLETLVWMPRVVRRVGREWATRHHSISRVSPHAQASLTIC